MHGEDLEVCGLDSVPCLAQFADYLRQLAFPTEELQEKLEEAGLECNCPGGGAAHSNDSYSMPTKKTPLT